MGPYCLDNGLRKQGRGGVAQTVLRVLDAIITGAISDSLDGIGVLRSPATAQRIGTRPLRCGEAEDLDLC